MYTLHIFFNTYAILWRISVLRPRKELIDILYKRPRYVLNNDHSIYTSLLEQTHPPAKGKSKNVNQQNFCKRMRKKNFQNFKTHRVYGGVDHSISRPPVQFERLGLPPINQGQLLVLKKRCNRDCSITISVNQLIGSNKGSQSFVFFINL